MVNVVKPTSRANPLSLAFGLPASVSFTPGSIATPVADIAVGGTKMERATELFLRFPNANRQFILDLFQKHCAMSRAGAATYYTTIRASLWTEQKAVWHDTKAKWKETREEWASKQASRKIAK